MATAQGQGTAVEPHPGVSGVGDCLELPNHGSCLFQHHPDPCCRLAFLWFHGDLVLPSFQENCSKVLCGTYILSFPSTKVSTWGGLVS